MLISDTISLVIILCVTCYMLYTAVGLWVLLAAVLSLVLVR